MVTYGHIYIYMVTYGHMCWLAAETLTLADELGCEELKSRTLKFIVDPAHTKDVFRSEGADDWEGVCVCMTVYDLLTDSH